MFRHDLAHTGATSDRLTLPLRRVWSFPSGAQSIVSSASVVGDSVYFGTRDDAAETGAPTRPNPNFGGLGSVYCLDASSGHRRWRFNRWQDTGIGWVDSTPTVVGGKVYFCSTDGYVYCITTEGKPVWRSKAGGLIEYTSPAVSGDRLFISSGYPDTGFVCMRLSDGYPLWHVSSEIPGRPAQYAYVSPAVADGVVYTGANNSVFFALDPKDGSTLWRYSAPGGNPYMLAPTVYNGRLYVTTDEFNPNLYAVSLTGHNELWRYTAPTQYAFSSSPAAANGRVYVGLGNPEQVLYAIDATGGGEKWHFSTGFAWIQGFTSSPAVAGGLVIVGGGPASPKATQDGHLFVIDAQTGALRWKDTVPKPIVASPAVANHRIFVGATDGVLYCYRDSAAASQSMPAPRSHPARSGAGRRPARSRAHASS